MICGPVTRRSLIALGVGAVIACNPHRDPKPEISVKAGIFYGGQIQNRSEWPLVLDATRQTQGFRIEFAHPLTRPAQVHWAMTRVVERGKGHAHAASDADGLPSTTLVPAGSQRFDQVIPFTTRDRPGDWKLSVSVDGRTLWDQTIHVIPKPTATSDD
jgi:hypothetical protein